MKRHLIIWWFFILGSLGLGSQLAASNQCIYNPKGCSDMNLCAVAVRNISSEYVWEKVDKYLPYVKEAQKRGLNCPSIRQSRGKLKPIVKVDELRSLFIRQTEQNRRKLQQTLSSLGYYESKVDGLYGKGTAGALRAYNKEYLGNADLAKPANVTALLDDLLRKKFLDEVAEPKLEIRLNLGSGNLTVEVDSGKPKKIEEAEELPPLDFAQIKASYDSGMYPQAFKDAQTLSVEGDPNAQLYLGKMYADGRGTLQITTAAHMWFNIASMNGSDEAYEERRSLAASMTSSAIEKAQQMAFDCIKSDYEDCGLILEPSRPTVTEKFQPDVGQLKNYFISQSVLKRKQIQYVLKQIGYYQSSVDGLWGFGTQRALLNYIGANQAVSEMSEIYTSLISEVDVPSSFAAPKTTSTNTANGEPPKKSAQGYTKAQAEAICAPKARLLANETEINRKKSSGGKTITCKSDSDLFTFGTNNRFGTSMGTTKCRESSGGGWPGLIPLLLETDPGSKARRAGEDAYQLAMKSCMAQYGWY